MNHRINARALHELLDDIAKGYQPHAAEIDNLRACLPEQPKQKTLVEIRDSVDAASRWAANGNTWTNNEKTLDMWLQEQKEQLDGLIDNGYTTPALPAGMRLADHWQYGRCVVAPATDGDGERMIFCLDNTSLAGAGRRWAHASSLTFIDAEPAKPAHPEFLETEADYRDAPEGTIVAKDNHRPAWKPNEHWFINNNPFDNREMAGGLNPAPSRVLRWGWGK